jgi:L-lysine 2,3-aminomutase
MIVGAKEFRMNLSPEIELEKALYVSTTAFNRHRFIVDVPYGGGKRLVSSVDREREISILRSLQFTKQNLVGDGKVVDLSVYFDPLRSISNKYRQNNAIKFIQ